jgi:hypothetical protein
MGEDRSPKGQTTDVEPGILLSQAPFDFDMTGKHPGMVPR